MRVKPEKVADIFLREPEIRLAVFIINA
jgi:hypothetical protein